MNEENDPPSLSNISVAARKFPFKCCLKEKDNEYVSFFLSKACLISPFVLNWLALKDFVIEFQNTA